MSYSAYRYSLEVTRPNVHACQFIQRHVFIYMNKPSLNFGQEEEVTRRALVGRVGWNRLNVGSRKTNNIYEGRQVMCVSTKRVKH